MVFWAKFIPLNAKQLACTIDNVQAHCDKMQIMITTTFQVLLALTTIQFPCHGYFETIDQYYRHRLCEVNEQTTLCISCIYLP